MTMDDDDDDSQTLQCARNSRILRATRYQLQTLYATILLTDSQLEWRKQTILYT